MQEIFKYPPEEQPHNFSVDRVSVDSKCVWTSICNFMSGKKPHLGVTDTNHNVNIFCYQVFGGSSLVFCGNRISDTNFLSVLGISNKLYRIPYFLSGLLVLKLESADTEIALHGLLNTQDAHAVYKLCMKL